MLAIAVFLGISALVFGLQDSPRGSVPEAAPSALTTETTSPQTTQSAETPAAATAAGSPSASQSKTSSPRKKTSSPEQSKSQEIELPRGTPVSVSGFRGSQTIFNAPIDAIGLNDQGYLIPDFNRAGLYSTGGWSERKPGFPGPAIIAAHVNQLDVNGNVIDDHFAQLHTMQAGDTITVEYSSGDRVTFTVHQSQAVDKATATNVDDPVAKSIWEPDTNDSVMRLFTCDEDTPWVEGHYTGNWVVWAENPTLEPAN